MHPDGFQAASDVECHRTASAARVGKIEIIVATASTDLAWIMKSGSPMMTSVSSSLVKISAAAVVSAIGCTHETAPTNPSIAIVSDVIRSDTIDTRVNAPL